MTLPNETATRKLAAVMFTDIKGFSKKMARNETAAFELLRTHDALLRVIASKYEGKVVKSIGDSFMVDFSSAVNAVKAAMDAQVRFWNFNKGKEELDMIEVRIGIHLGDVMLSGDDMYGDGVNIASRIEAITEPNRICISSDIYSQVKNKMDIRVFRMGDIPLKNIPDPVEIFEILLDSVPELSSPSATAQQALAKQRVDDTAEVEGEEARSIEAAKKRGSMPVPKDEDTASQVEALYKKAEQLYNEGKIDEAERVVEQIGRIDPGYHAAIERKKAEEEKEKQVNAHYERAGTFIREGNFDLAEKEVKEIFQLIPLHGGAQQLQLQIEEERYRRAEEERNVRLDKERKTRKEKDKQVDELTRTTEEQIEKDELAEAHETLKKIYALEPNFTAGERLEEKLRRAEATKVDRERQQAFLEGQKLREESVAQSQERLLERQQARVRHRQGEAEEPTRHINTKYLVWAGAAIVFVFLAYISYPKIKRTFFPVSASIAVMPFSGSVDDVQDDTLNHVLPTMFAQDLSRIEHIQIVAPLQRIIQASDYPGVASENQVRYVLHGSVKRIGSGFSVNVRLYDHDQQRLLMTQKFDGDYATIGRLRTAVAEAILEQTGVEGPAPTIPVTTTNPAAYESYVNGLYLLGRNSLPMLDAASRDFQEALRLDTLFASAYVGLAEVRLHAFRLSNGIDEGPLREAYDLAQKAVRLNTREYLGYVCIAEANLLTRRFDKVVPNIQKCLAIQPEDENAYRVQAELELVTGNYEQAYNDALHAIKRVPDDPNLQVTLGLTAQFKKNYLESIKAFRQAIALGLPDSLITARYLHQAWSGKEDYDNVIMYFQGTLKQDPRDYQAYYWISRAYQMKPSIAEFKNWSGRGIALLESHLDKTPGDALAHAYLGLFLARSGKSDDGEAEMAKAVALAPNSTKVLFRQANMFAIEGKTQPAVSALRDALNRDFDFSEILNPDFTLLRNDTSFTSATTKNLEF